MSGVIVREHPDGLDSFRIIGARLRQKVSGIDGRLGSWDRYVQTFGFRQWHQENPITPEQLAAVEDGFRNLRIRAVTGHSDGAARRNAVPDNFLGNC